MKTQVLYIHPVDKKEMDSIKAFCESQNIMYVESKDEVYDPEFVRKIERGRQDYKEGKGKTYTTDQLNELWR